MSGILDVPEHENLGQYLGLSTAIGRNKQEVFKFVKDRVWSRLNSWKHKALSKSGKEVLIKIVLQALPNHVMSLFLLPKSIWNVIQGIIAKFWWGSGGNNGRGIHWVSWDRLSQHRSHSGLSFKKLRDFNVAMLGKIGWSLHTKPNSLVGQLLKARYYSSTTFLEAPLGSNPSYVWRSIRESQGVLKSGLLWKIDKGEAVSIWLDPWIPDQENPFVTSDFDVANGVFFVSDLISNGRWNVNLISSIFNQRDRDFILAILLAVSATVDSQYWMLEKFGKYSVKSAYRRLANSTEVVVPNDVKAMWNKFWKVPAAPKVKNFVWRAIGGAVPCRSSLLYRHVPIMDECPFCLQGSETVLHLLIDCDFAKIVWHSSYLGWFTLPTNSFVDWLKSILALFNPKDAAATG